MGGGKDGGGSFFPQQQLYTDPQTGKSFDTAADLNAAIDKRTADTQTAADKAKADADAAAAQNETNFQTRKSNAYNDALNAITQSFRNAGVDPNNYMSDYINPALTRSVNSVPDLAPDVSTYFPSSLGQSIVNDATSARRTGLTNTLNNTFTPNYATTMLPDTVMDNPINDILAKQFDPLGAQLTNALNRGTLNQAGYNAAADKMATDRTAARSQLRTLGSNILSTDRGALDTLASGARGDIAGLTLGGAYDPSAYTSRASQLVSSDLSGFPGALTNAVGGSQFSDIQSLLNAGGAVQGGNNPTAANPAGAGVLGQDNTTNVKRGLGSTGAF